MKLTKEQVASLTSGLRQPKYRKPAQHNHEIWRQCENCGAWNDLRKDDTCTECFTPFKSTNAIPYTIRRHTFTKQRSK